MKQITKVIRHMLHRKVSRLLQGMAKPLLPLVLGIAVFVPAGHSQQVLQGIVALVNDEVISSLDLRERLGLVIAATGGVNSQEELQRMQQEVLRAMVDERLQLQEAAKFEVQIPRQEIEEAYARIAQSFNQTPEQFEQSLRQYGSAKRTLLIQLQAEFAWQQLVRGRLGSQVNISDEEVEENIRRMEENAGKSEYSVSEIYLTIDNPNRASSVEASANRYVEQIRGGAQFAQIARNFSQSSSAARGGSLGWVSEGQLPTVLENAITGLDVGQISDPIRTAGGVYILRLDDRRRILTADPLDAQVDLRQIYLSFTQQSTQEEVQAFIDKAEQLTPTIQSCADMPSIAAQLDPRAQFVNVGLVSLRDLGAELRQILDDIEIGHATDPLVSQDGVRILAVCDRVLPDVTPPTEDEIYLQLEQQRLALMARRYLRDLRRDAIIDYR